MVRVENQDRRDKYEAEQAERAETEIDISEAKETEQELGF